MKFSPTFPVSPKIPWLSAKIFKFPDFSLTGKSSLIFPGIPGFPVLVGTLIDTGDGGGLSYKR